VSAIERPIENEIRSVFRADLRETAVPLAVEVPGVGQPILGLLIRAEDTLERNRRYGRFAVGWAPRPWAKTVVAAQASTSRSSRRFVIGEPPWNVARILAFGVTGRESVAPNPAGSALRTRSRELFGSNSYSARPLRNRRQRFVALQRQNPKPKLKPADRQQDFDIFNLFDSDGVLA